MKDFGSAGQNFAFETRIENSALADAVGGATAIKKAFYHVLQSRKVKFPVTAFRIFYTQNENGLTLRAKDADTGNSRTFMSITFSQGQNISPDQIETCLSAMNRFEKKAKYPHEDPHPHN